MRWNLRMTAAQRGLWKASDLAQALAGAGAGAVGRQDAGDAVEGAGAGAGDRKRPETSPRGCTHVSDDNWISTPVAAGPTMTGRHHSFSAARGNLHGHEIHEG